MRQRIATYAVAVGAVLLLLFALDGRAAQVRAEDSLAPVWCHDGEQWIGFFGGFPGSASQGELTECLERSAARGEILAIRAWLGDGEVRFLADDEAFVWRTTRAGSLSSTDVWLEFIAYEDRAEFGFPSCRYVWRDSSLELVLRPLQECGLEHSLLPEIEPSDPDFTIYVVGRQFVLDGDSGWYHLSEDITGRYGDPSPHSVVVLYDRYPGVWVGTEPRADLEDRSFSALFHARKHPVQEPLAGPDWNWPAFRFFDWEKQVLRRAVPQGLVRADRSLRSEDRDEYWTGLQVLVEAIMNDLFGGQAGPVELSRERIWLYESFTLGRTIHLADANIQNLFIELAHIVSGQRSGFGDTYTATWLMLWDRYVQGFDRQRALQLASIHGVEVGNPPPVKQVSERTKDLRTALLLRAPVSLSDHEPIEPSTLLRQLVLEVGRRYAPGLDTLLVTYDEAPWCTDELVDADGQPYRVWRGPFARFTVNESGSWSGLWPIQFHELSDLPIGWYVRGVLTAPGRVRVEITTQCPDGESQEPQLVGYVEIVVVDPGEGE